MRVLQLGPFPPPHGGVQANLVAIRNYLRENGFGASVINLNRFRRPDFDEVYFPAHAVALTRLLWRLPYDILHVHHGGNITLRLQALWLLCTLMPGKKTVMTFHSGGYPSSPEGRRIHAGTPLARIFRRFDALIGVNGEIMGMFRRMGVAPERMHLIYPHAVDRNGMAEEFPPALQNFFADHDPVLVTVGLLEPEYDLTMQIDVLGQVRKRHPAAGLVIAGSGSLENTLRGYIAAKPYAGDVVLYGDMPHSVTLRAIAHASVFLRTTHYDGDSVAVREALHLNTLVIATDNGMRPPGVHLIPVGNPDALLHGVEKSLSSCRQKPQSPSLASEQVNIQGIINLYKNLMVRDRT